MRVATFRYTHNSFEKFQCFNNGKEFWEQWTSTGEFFFPCNKLGITNQGELCDFVSNGLLEGHLILIAK